MVNGFFYKFRLRGMTISSRIYVLDGRVFAIESYFVSS